MAGPLERLPPELVLNIFKFVSLQDIIPFLQTCKNIASIVSGHFGENEAVAAKYETLECEDWGDAPVTTIDLIHLVQKYHFIRPLVHELKTTYVPEYDVDEIMPAIEEQYTNARRRVVEKIDLVALESEYAQWMPRNRIDQLRADLAALDIHSYTVVLLSLLPELEEWHVVGPLGTLSAKLEPLMEAAVSASSSSSENLRKGNSTLPLLRNLASVSVEHWDTENGTPLWDLATLVYLPFLMELECSAIEAWSYDWADATPGASIGFGAHAGITPMSEDSAPTRFGPESGILRANGPQILHLVLSRSAISPDQLAAFVAPLQKLSYIEYDHGDCIVGGPPCEMINWEIWAQDLAQRMAPMLDRTDQLLELSFDDEPGEFEVMSRSRKKKEKGLRYKLKGKVPRSATRVTVSANGMVTQYFQ